MRDIKIDTAATLASHWRNGGKAVWAAVDLRNGLFITWAVTKHGLARTLDKMAGQLDGLVEADGIGFVRIERKGKYE